MAAFASDRRAGWVRVLVLIMCALFIFAMVAAPPAYAVGETVALFTAAAVLSSAVAALGFKLSTDAEGQATLSKMVEDFAKVSWATGLVIVGSRVNGLINGLNYIKMAVHNGKTYLDERVIAWCQQWLAQNGVYDAGSVTFPSDFLSLSGFTFSGNMSNSTRGGLFVSPSAAIDSPVLSLSDALNFFGVSSLPDHASYWQSNKCVVCWSDFPGHEYLYFVYTNDSDILWFTRDSSSSGKLKVNFNGYQMEEYSFSTGKWSFLGNATTYIYDYDTSEVLGITNFLVSESSNTTGLSGTDTLGKDVIDLTLDQILQKLKDWAQDWYDAGADSATNEASGALDLPLTVTDGAATANPALNPDVVYNPPFSLPWPDVRSGETSSSTTEAGQANADAAQTATADVAENQTIVDSLVTWALGYISPDTGLFSKFPLCIPYDAYLIVCSALGVDAVDASTVYGAEPGDLAGVVTSGTSTYSDFQPIIHLEHDFELDGRTYPLEITIDLTPWQPLVDLAREGVAILFMAELIASEYRRIKGH